MKTIICIIIFLPLSVYSQWSPIFLHSDQISDLFVINADTIVTITGGGAGRIYHSYDGGNSWLSYQTIMNYSWFSDVDFPNSTVGYACGGTAFGSYRNVITKTEDSGLTWDTVTTNSFSGYSFSNIAFVDENIGVISGEQGLMVRTVDGGLNFQAFSLPNNETASTIKAIQDSVFILGAYKVQNNVSDTWEYMIYKSIDFGVSWQKKWSETLTASTGYNNKIVNDIMFIDGQNGYAVGGLGILLKTSDGGENWNDSYISPHSSLSAVYAQSNKLYTNLAGGIFVSNNDGNSWQPQNVNLPAAVSRIVFANDSIGFLLAGGNVYKTTNGGYFLRVDNSVNDALKVYPNPAKDFISIEITKDMELLSIDFYSVDGKLIKRFSPSDKLLDFSQEVTGEYLLRLVTEQGVLTKHIIIN